MQHYVFTGCSSSEDDDEVNDIVGYWEIYEAYIANKYYSETRKVEGFIQINSDGTFISDDETGNWNLDGSILMLKSKDGNTNSFGVLSLTSTNLTLKYEDSGSTVILYFKKSGNSNNNN